MPPQPSILKVLFVTLLASVGLFGQQGSAAAGARLLDLEGRTANPFSDKAAKLIAFIFVRTDCPISNSYAPKIRALHEQYASRGVTFWVVYPGAAESIAGIRQHLSDFSYPCGALRDPRSIFAKESKVRVTPEAAIYRPNGTLLYHGRIDDRHVDFGKVKPEAARHELAEALACAVEGKPISPAAGPAIGCFIEEVKE